jgi:hypothetical protein
MYERNSTQCAGWVERRDTHQFISVMAGLVPAIHVFPVVGHDDVDARHKAGHDG